jgi:DNA helicase HerA-like ATPase
MMKIEEPQHEASEHLEPPIEPSASEQLALVMEDLRAMLTHVSERASELSARYGNVAPASVAAIQRALLSLESQGGEKLFGEPGLDIADLMRVAPNGHGAVNILSAERLMQTPRLYSTLLLWLLSELFEDLPEVGDVEKPKLVFFFDEAHLLFNDAPKALVEKIEQLVRLIRSKGIGVYFITQNPADIPSAVLGQLSNRIQHALRAFTPQDQKGVKAAAQTFRPNPAFDTAEAITTLGIGEALVSVLDAKGSPTIVQKTLIRPPLSRVGPIDEALRTEIIASSPIAGVYEQVINRESAHEILNARVERKATDASSLWGTSRATGTGGAAPSAPAPRPAPRAAAPARRQSASVLETVGKNVLRAAGSQIGREIARGLLGAMLKR